MFVVSTDSSSVQSAERDKLLVAITTAPGAILTSPCLLEGLVLPCADVPLA